VDTLAKIRLPVRLTGLVVSFALAAVATLSVCPALAAALANDAHRCCKTSSSHAPASDESGCRTKCAASGSVIITPLGSNAGLSFAGQTPLALTETYIPKLLVETSVAPTARAAGPPRPIYELNSALLI
jgi:hypothetical protein